MTLKPPTRAFPKLVMKEWPERVGEYCVDYSPLTEAEIQAVRPTLERLYANSKALSDFTRVVDQTGILKQPTAFDAAMDETRKEDAEFWEGIERDLKP